MAELAKVGVLFPRGEKTSLKDVQVIAAQHNQPLQTQVSKVIEGWEGKPKGLKQILWERGLFHIDKSWKIVLISKMRKPSFSPLVVPLELLSIAHQSFTLNLQEKELNIHGDIPRACIVAHP